MDQSKTADEESVHARREPEETEDPLFPAATVEGGLCRLDMPGEASTDEAVAPRHRRE